MFKFKKQSPTLPKAQIKETKSEPGSNSSSNQVTPITLLNRKRISLKSLYNSKKKSLRKRGSRKEKSEEKSERERSEDTQISERENPKKILSHPDKFDLISLPNNTDFNSNFETLSDNFWHDAVSGSVKNSFDTDQQIQGGPGLMSVWASGRLGFWASGHLSFWASGHLDFWASGHLGI